MLHFLHWCYTRFALLLPNQNKIISWWSNTNRISLSLRAHLILTLSAWLLLLNCAVFSPVTITYYTDLQRPFHHQSKLEYLVSYTLITFTFNTEHLQQRMLTYLADQWLQMSLPMSVIHNSTHAHYHCISSLTSMVPLGEHPHTWLGRNAQKACAVDKRMETTVRCLLQII